MSTSLFARNERHRLILMALRIRVAVFAAVGIPIVLSAELSPIGAAASFACLVAAAAIPLIVRRVTPLSGVGVAATIDVLLSFGVWVLVPVAAPITLIVTVWAVASMVFLAPSRAAERFALFAIIVEASKLLVIAFDPDLLDRSLGGLVWSVVGRAAVISASYFVTRALDRYLSRLYVASESASARYRRLMDAAPTALVVLTDDEVVYANLAATKLLDPGGSGLAGLAFSELIGSAHRTAFDDRIKRVMSRLESSRIDGIDVREPDSGESHIIDMAMNPVDMGDGLSVQVALHDVSAQRRAETELAETRLNYRSFFERIPVALYRTRPNGDIIQANRGLVELLGARSEAELVGLSATDFYADPSDREHMTTMLADDRIVVGYETRLRRLDGRVIWVRDTARLIDTDIGPVYEGAMVDVTGRRNIEDELWSRAMQQEAAASIGQLALEADDIVSVMRSVSETVARVLRCDGVVVLQRAESGFVIAGQSTGLDLEASSFSDLADRAHMTAAPVVLRSESEMQFAAPSLADHGVTSAIAVMIPGTEMEFGTLVACSLRERVFTSDDLNFLHAVANVLAAAVDRSVANERLEELLRSKDAFVASVSHELRTPLTVVTGMAHELQERWADLTDEEMDEFTKMLVEQSRDMADLIEDLLVAARSNIGNVAVRNEPVDLQDQVRNVLAGFTDTGDKIITPTLEVGYADADPIRVRQIIRNLITNALRYGGPNIEVVMSSTAGARIIEVIDDGEGIPEADRERIFVAYERAHHTEGQPGSVGLGLTVSAPLRTSWADR